MFKDISPDDKSIKAFKTYKQFTFTNSDSGSGIFGLEGISGSFHNFLTGSAASQSFCGFNEDSKSLQKHYSTWYSMGTFFKLPFYIFTHFPDLEALLPRINARGKNCTGGSTITREIFHFRPLFFHFSVRDIFIYFLLNVIPLVRSILSGVDSAYLIGVWAGFSRAPGIHSLTYIHTHVHSDARTFTHTHKTHTYTIKIILFVEIY